MLPSTHACEFKLYSGFCARFTLILKLWGFRKANLKWLPVCFHRHTGMLMNYFFQRWALTQRPWTNIFFHVSLKAPRVLRRLNLRSSLPLVNPHGQQARHLKTRSSALPVYIVCYSHLEVLTLIGYIKVQDGSDPQITEEDIPWWKWKLTLRRKKEWLGSFMYVIRFDSSSDYYVLETSKFWMHG